MNRDNLISKAQIKRVSKPFGWILQLVAAAAILLFAGCSSASSKGSESGGKTATDRQAAKGTSMVRDTASYATTAVQYIQPPYRLLLPGQLKPFEQVAIYAKVTGFVKNLKVDIGDQVHKGQLLALLEAPEMNQRYLSDRSSQQKLYGDYLYAKQAYSRLETASQTEGAVAAGELDQAKAAMQGAESAYKAAKAATSGTQQLQDYLQIRAPFDGVITERNVSQGALTGANAGQPMLTMVQKNKLRLTLTLPEKHAASVQKGMEVSFTVSAQPGRKFKARLSRSASLLDPHDRSLTLEFDVSNPDGQLSGGDYAQVELDLKRQYPTYWVPEESILRAQSGTFIQTLHKNVLTRVLVKEGLSEGSLTEIFGDIQQNVQVLLKPSEELKDGPLLGFNN